MGSSAGCVPLRGSKRHLVGSGRPAVVAFWMIDLLLQHEALAVTVIKEPTKGGRPLISLISCSTEKPTDLIGLPRIPYLHGGAAVP
jgi:hypothetical protein